MKRTTSLNLTSGPILKTLSELALPIMASSMLATAYNITDMAWIGMLGAKAVAGVGVGAPGPVDSEGVIYKTANLGWGVFSIKETLENILKLPVMAGNDANVAALGEMWQGGGKGYSDIVMVTLGTGVGGGVIIGGKILTGINGAAGEIGHIRMKDDEEFACGCGNKGCLEQYASANGIVMITKRYLDAHPEEETTLRDVEKITSKEIFDEAKKGDKVSILMVDEVGRMLGKALAAVACVVNPEAFVIGGGMSKAGDILIDAIKKYYTKYAFHASRETVFKMAELSNSAGIYGAVRLVLE